MRNIMPVTVNECDMGETSQSGIAKTADVTVIESEISPRHSQRVRKVTLSQTLGATFIAVAVDVCVQCHVLDRQALPTFAC